MTLRRASGITGAAIYPSVQVKFYTRSSPAKGKATMAVTQNQVLEALKRVKGPDLSGNIVDLGLVSEVLIKDGKAYFSITVPART